MKAEVRMQNEEGVRQRMFGCLNSSFLILPLLPLLDELNAVLAA
jgi:hypothetical protein